MHGDLSSSGANRTYGGGWTAMEADFGLHYALLQPSEEEWKATVNDTTRAPYACLHLWMKCVGSVLRVYLFVDTLDDGTKVPPQSSFDPAREKLIADSLRGKILANRLPVRATINVAGGEFFVTLPHDQLAHKSTAEVHIKVHGWLRFAKFPVAKCGVAAAPAPRHQPPPVQYLVHTYTMENSKSVDDTMSALVQATAKHLSYYQCLLDITIYYISMEREHIPYYLANPFLEKNSQSGRLVFLTKDSNRPYQVNGKSYKWQAVYMNLMIMQHWQHEQFPKVRILFIDPDEYVHAKVSMMSNLHDVLQKHDVANFQRKDTICADCNGPEYAINIRSHTFQMSDNHISTKVSLNPNNAGCLMVHFSLCGNNQTSVIRLNSHIAYIVHFGNTLSVRHQAGESSFNGYAADLDSLNRCLPPPNITAGYNRTAMHDIYEVLAMPSDMVEDFVAVTLYDWYQTRGLQTAVGLGVGVVATCVLVAGVVWRVLGRMGASRSRP